VGGFDVSEPLPNWNLTHISKDVLPALRERGVKEDQITTMLVDNPRVYFGSERDVTPKL